MGSNKGEAVWQALLVNEQENKGLILLPKCASQYVRQHKVSKSKKWVSIQPGGPEYCGTFHVAAFIRHPLDRLVSCWEYFRTTNRAYVKGNPSFGKQVSGTFLHFCSYVLSTPDELLDKHCRPQSTLIANCAHSFIKWDFVELSNYLGVDLPKVKINTSKRKEDWRAYFKDNPSLLIKMENRYKHDMGHWS